MFTIAQNLLRTHPLGCRFTENRIDPSLKNKMRDQGRYEGDGQIARYSAIEAQKKHKQRSSIPKTQLTDKTTYLNPLPFIESTEKIDPLFC